jgi:hypothetical protein
MAHRTGGRSTRARFIALTAVAAGITLPLVTSSSASASTTVDFAYIGDVPYTAPEQLLLPNLVSDINAHPAVQFTAHAGDTKGGSDSCSPAWMTQTQNGFKGLTNPFWVTPGDNDWTDCHRDSNGGYDALERLSAFRTSYYPVATETSPVNSGAKITVVSQASSSDPTQQEFLENTLFNKDCVTFGDVHSVTSGNGLLPPNDPFYLSYNPTNVSNIFLGGNSPSLLAPINLPAVHTQAERNAEVARRTAANLAWVDAIFDAAIANHSEGVFLMMQAEPALLSEQPTTALSPSYSSAGQNVTGNDTVSAADEFASLRAKIVARATAFGKPVVLAHGDQHTYLVTKGYAGVANLTKLENPGKSNAVKKFIEVKADCGTAALFSQTLHTFDGTNIATDTAPAFAPMFDVTPPVNVPEGSLAIGLAGAGVVALAWMLVANRRRALR